MTQKLEDGRGIDEKGCIVGTDGSGNAYPVRVNSSGQLILAALKGEDATLDRMKVAPYYNGVYISSATTTVVKSGAGLLSHITITETAAGQIIVYDNTAASGTQIVVVKSSIAEGTYWFHRPFTTGLTILTNAASKLSVSYL